MPYKSPNGLFAAHQIEKVGIGFGGFEFVDQKLHRFDVVHRVQEFAQQPHFLQLLVGNQQFFAAGAGAVDVDGGK